MIFSATARTATVAVALFVSVSTHAAIVADFDVIGVGIGLPATTNSVGSAILDDTGILSFIITTDIFIDTGVPGNVSVQIEFEQTFAGTLAGTGFSGVSITDQTPTSCVDTGSTGIFASSGCSGFIVNDTFDVITEPVIFDFSLGGTTVIDWLGGSTQAQGSLPLDPSNGYVRYTLTTIQPSAVPVPTAAWLFGSALIGLSGIKRKK